MWVSITSGAREDVEELPLRTGVPVPTIPQGLPPAGVLVMPAHVLCCTEAPGVQAARHLKSHTGHLDTRCGTIAPALKSK